MDNQHRMIAGYRELTEVDIALMNEIKAEGAVIEALLLRVHEHIDAQDPTRTEDRPNSQNPYRWLAIATTDLQTGLMALNRAVAQPATFA